VDKQHGISLTDIAFLLCDIKYHLPLIITRKKVFCQARCKQFARLGKPAGKMLV